MALIKSISGIRGTIGGIPGDNLTPIDIVKFSAAFGVTLLNRQKKVKVVVGRDGRMSGAMVSSLVIQTLTGLGIDVIDLGLSTTPTVEYAVTSEAAAGGIIVTASHNPKEWNALKLLNSDGEFIDADWGKQVLEIAAADNYKFAAVDSLGTVIINDTYRQKHINAIVDYPQVNKTAIAEAGFKVVVDAINSTGATFVPALLEALGVKDIIVINGDVTGKFAHNPEPLPEHLSGLSAAVITNKAHIGIAVDPDVDRLCFVNEDGSMFGEEYTLVAVADYYLKHKPGNTVSNMSSTRSLKEITVKKGHNYAAAPVGEVNVVAKMKATDAVIGGEGNGGVIVADFHYGRDALIGIALFLSHLAEYKKGMTSLRKLYPDYFISKNKIELKKDTNISSIFAAIKKKYAKHPVDDSDGLKIHFDDDWVHLRPSNTEPVIRIYAESNFETTANNIATRIMQDIKEFSKEI